MTAAGRPGRRAGYGSVPRQRSSAGGALLTPAEVAGELRITEKTLANWRSLGRGPAFVKVGGRVRYRRQAVDESLV